VSKKKAVKKKPPPKKKNNPRKLAAAKLESSALSLEDAEELGIEVLTAAQTKVLFPKHNVPSLKINYFDEHGTSRPEIYRVRFLAEPLPGAFGQVAEKPPRYMQAGDTPPAAYFPRTVNWAEIALDTDRTIIFTEGEFKAACACKFGFPTIGLGGVYSWKSNTLGWALLPELERFEWIGRDVVIAFDSDAATNPAVSAAIASFVSEMSRRGALMRVAVLPVVDTYDKTGLDDFLFVEGAAAFTDVLDEAISDDLTEKLWKFNKRFSTVMLPGMIYDHEECEFFSLDIWKKLRSNVWATKLMATPVKRVKVAVEWLEWELRRCFRKVTYDPGKDRVVNGNLLNQWKGWGVEPKKGSVKPWKDLLDYLFEGTDPIGRVWFENWCLYPLKFPGTKLLTAVGIWSLDQGIGKSQVGFTLKRIYGENFSVINQRMFESGFNGYSVKKQFIMIDDVSGHDSRSKADVFKSLITQEDIEVNVKFLPTYQLPDTINYLITSNQPNAFYLEERDRRFFIHECLVEMKPRVYYDKYHKWLDDIGPAALFHYAQHDHDFGDFHPKHAAPVTQAKLNMIDSAKGELALWVSELCTDPQSKLTVDRHEFKRDLWTPRELVDFFDQERKGRACTPNVMGIALRQYFKQAAGGRTIRPNGKSERFYMIRNPAKWLKASTKELNQHVKTYRNREGGNDGKGY